MELQNQYDENRSFNCTAHEMALKLDKKTFHLLAFAAAT